MNLSPKQTKRIRILPTCASDPRCFIFGKSGGLRNNSMRDIEKAQCRFLLSKLEARLQVFEIERVGLNFELGSPQIPTRPESGGDCASGRRAH
jgi:hypothetical protein